MDLYSNLPYRSSFVGRKQELFEVKQSIDEGNNLIVIEGISGCGKTSVALEIAHLYSERALEGKALELKTKKTFQAFIWVDAKYKDVRLDNLLDLIGYVLDYSAIGTQSGKQKEVTAINVMREHGTLLILDNFETLTSTDSGEILSFLHKIPSNSQVIITTRKKLDVKGKTIMIANFSKNDAITFIDSTIKHMGAEELKQINSEQKNQLYMATDGSPLAIEWALGQMRRRGTTLESVFQLLGRGTSDVFSRLFSQAWSSLSDATKRVLIAMTIFRAPVSWNTLRFTVNMDEAEFDQSIGEMSELYLINISTLVERAKTQYSLHPLTHSFIRFHYQDFPGLLEIYSQNAVQYYIDYSKTTNETIVAGDESKALASEIDNILFLLSWCKSVEKYSHIVDLFLGIHDLLFNLGFFEERIQYAIEAANACDKLKNGKIKGELLNIAGGTLPLLGRYAEAEKLLNEGLQSARSTDNSDDTTARLLRTLALNKYRQGQIEEAINYLNGTDELALHSGDNNNYIDILSLRGTIEFYAGKYGDSLNTQTLMLNTATNIGWERAKCYALRDIAEVLMVQKNYSKAQGLLNEALAISQAYDDRRQTARINLSLAKLFLHVGRIREVEDVIDQSIQIFKKLGMNNEREEADALKNAFRQIPKVVWPFYTLFYQPKARYSDVPIGGE